MYIICITHVTWDPNKAETNFKKHGIRFSDAELVLYDPFAMTTEEQVVTKGKPELRYILIRIYLMNSAQGRRKQDTAIKR